MEIKKAKKRDLERSRPLRLFLSLMSVLAFVALLSVAPLIISTVAERMERDVDEIIEDLRLDLQEDEEVISSMQNETQDEVTEIIQPVEALTEVEDIQEQPVEMEAVAEEIVEKELEEIKEIQEETTVPMADSEEANLVDQSQNENPELAKELPYFPGGMTALVDYFSKNLKYPQSAQKRRKTGHVAVSFVIETDGSLSDFKIQKSADPELDKEVMRVAQGMPKWKPGKQNGKPCRTFFVVPVDFDLFNR